MKPADKETGEILPLNYVNKSDETMEVVVPLQPGEKLNERISKTPIGQAKFFKKDEEFSLVFQASTMVKIACLNDAERSLWMMLAGLLDYDCYVKKDDRCINKGQIAGIMGWSRKKTYAALKTLFNEQIIAYTTIGVETYLLVNPLYIHRGNTSEVDEKKKMFMQAYENSPK
jgi:hypothetical protein